MCIVHCSTFIVYISYLLKCKPSSLNTYSTLYFGVTYMSCGLRIEKKAKPLFNSHFQLIKNNRGQGAIKLYN